MSSPRSSPRFLDKFSDSIEFFGGDFVLLASEKRSHNLLSRSFEERIHDMSQNGLPDCAPGNDRFIDIPKPVFSVLDVSFFFENSQLSSHCRVAGRAGEIVHDVACRRASSTVEDVHDLALAHCQVRMIVFWHV
jgi:hypothetical protein